MVYTPTTPLRDVVLSTRSRNGLASLPSPPETLADLARLTADEAMRGRSLGRKSIRGLRQVLAEVGLDFAPEPPEPPPPERLRVANVRAALADKAARMAPGPRSMPELLDALGVPRATGRAWANRSGEIPERYTEDILGLLTGPYPDAPSEAGEDGRRLLALAQG